MAKVKFTEDEVPEFTLLPPGDYQFQVVGFDQGLQTGGKTNGCTRVELKQKLFDQSGHAVAQLTDGLTFPETRKPDLDQFLQGRINMFVKSSNLFAENGLEKGGEVDLTAETTMGLRGWCRVKQEPSSSDPKKIYNRIDRYLTDREKLPRVPQEAEEEDRPF